MRSRPRMRETVEWVQSRPVAAVLCFDVRTAAGYPHDRYQGLGDEESCHVLCPILFHSRDSKMQTTSLKSESLQHTSNQPLSPHHQTP
jgi:hypothetical protein